MDVLIAHTPSGHLHAVTCDHPPGFGLSFEHNMVAQGLTVTRRSLEEHLQQQRRSPAVKPVPDGASIAAPASLDKNDENSANARRVQDAKNSGGGPTLPEVGVELVHPVIGWATVTHVVTLDGQAVPVATGPKGQTLVKAGQWRAATEFDRPRWMWPQVNLSSCVQIDNHTASLAEPLCTQKASFMPTLF